VNAHDELLQEVYSCKCCPTDFGFTRPGPDSPYFKFPPTIGATGQAHLLFVGINPRLSGNDELFERANGNISYFAALAKNQDQGQSYIANNGPERHYYHHVAIVEALYGKGEKFENHAAVTELFFCGTKRTKNLPWNGSPCADRYFERVFLKVRPRIVICVWKKAFDYLRSRFYEGPNEGFLISLGGHTAVVVYLAHPNTRRYL
jgi:hypothetical protein